VAQTAQGGCPPYFYDTLEWSAADMVLILICRRRPADL